MPEETKEIYLLYVGQKLLSNDKKYYCYLEIAPDTNDGRSVEYSINDLRFFPKSLSSGLAGTIFMINSVDENSVQKLSDRYFGRWQNREQVRQWQAETRAVSVQHQRLVENKKEYMTDLVVESLEPIKEIVSEMSPLRKQALVAFIIEYLLR